MAAKPSGLAYLRKGFCFDKEHDELFALGWPHVRRLTDDDDVDVLRVASLALLAPEFDLSVSWPRRVAAALVHTWGVGALFDFAPGERLFKKKARAAMHDTRIPSEAQVRDYLEQRLHRAPLWATERATRSFVLMLEALTSTELVVEAILDALEAMDPDQLVAWGTQPAWVSFQLGYLLLRLDDKGAKKARERMAAVAAVGTAWADATEVPHDTPNHTRSLRLVLEGAAAADAITDRELRWYAHAVGDAERVAERVRRHPGGALPDVRLAWLGGADLLEARTFRRWRRMEVRDRLWFQSCIAPIQHPRTAITMANMLTSPSVKEVAKEWLYQHRDFALAALEPMRAENERARKALEILRTPLRGG